MIPHPLVLESHPETFTFIANTEIQISDRSTELETLADYFNEFCSSALGRALEIQYRISDSAPSFIRMSLAREETSPDSPEGYRLYIGSGGIELQAGTTQGLFWSIQSLIVLMADARTHTSSEGNLVLKGVSIEDQPRFPWRGLLLDCGRHFMTVEFIKRMCDLMALFKMNRLHWHLTEDQGWRIGIPGYPLLTEVSAWRTEPDGSRYGGYYNTDEIREVVDHAASRYITVVPEIELPGHCRAALAAYPHLSCTGGPFEVPNQWGIYKDVYCAGREETFEFLKDVFAHVVELFPSEYIHIGGDECPKERWRHCPRCQRRIQEEGLADEKALQTWFIQRAEHILKQYHRRLIGWDEILEGGLTPHATVQSWRGMEGGEEAVRQGHQTILSPMTHTYLNFPVSTLGLHQVYAFEPLKTISESQHQLVLGGECAMWTEYAPQDQVDSMLFPRLLAMADVLWASPGHRSFTGFYRRLEAAYPLLKDRGVQTGSEAQPVTIDISLTGRRRWQVQLSCEVPDSEVRYTLDGSFPTLQSAGDRRFHINRGGTVTAQAFLQGKPYGDPSKRVVWDHAAVGASIDCPARSLEAENVKKLIDGIGALGDFEDPHWVHVEESRLDVIVDLKSDQTVKNLSATFFQSSPFGIYLPQRFKVMVSMDGGTFRTIDTLHHHHTLQHRKPFRHTFSVTIHDDSVRYIRVIADPLTTCPENSPRAGEPTTLYVDEIRVE
jgi:hexosaminidase